MALSKPWMEAAGVKMGADGRPEGGSSVLPFILSAVCMLLVAGLMRHVMAMSNLTTLVQGLMVGFGVGAFFIAPWTMINNAYGMRPFKLTLIDGGYAIIGCSIIGVILALF
jgi:Protein of unknown function (DUF1761)